MKDKNSKKKAVLCSLFIIAAAVFAYVYAEREKCRKKERAARVEAFIARHRDYYRRRKDAARENAEK